MKVSGRFCSKSSILIPFYSLASQHVLLLIHSRDSQVC